MTAPEEICLLPTGLAIPFFKELIEGPMDYGMSVLVEFEPDSIWYEASLTLAAHALKDGIRTDYHTFQHSPNEVIEAFGRFGLDFKQLEGDKSLRILDSYTVQTGIGTPKEPPSASWRYLTQSVKLSDWSIADVQRIKSGVPEEDKRRLHIDDNTGIMLQYNDEKAFIDNWRTRHRPHTRAQETVMFNSLMKGAASDAFTKQFELLSDAIVDIKNQENEGRIQHFLRVRAMRGRPYDSRWRRLSLSNTGEVGLAD